MNEDKKCHQVDLQRMQRPNSVFNFIPTFFSGCDTRP